MGQLHSWLLSSDAYGIFHANIDYLTKFFPSWKIDWAESLLFDKTFQNRQKSLCLHIIQWCSNNRGLLAARRANKHIAQSNALGKGTPTYFALKEQKNPTTNAFALTARRFHIHSYLGRCPRLKACWPFRPLFSEQQCNSLSFLEYKFHGLRVERLHGG